PAGASSRSRTTPSRSSTSWSARSTSAGGLGSPTEYRAKGEPSHEGNNPGRDLGRNPRSADRRSPGGLRNDARVGSGGQNRALLPAVSGQRDDRVQGERPCQEAGSTCGNGRSPRE